MTSRLIRNGTLQNGIFARQSFVRHAFVVQSPTEPVCVSMVQECTE